MSETIALDTNILLNVLRTKDPPEHRAGTLKLFQVIVSKKISVIISAITITELFRKPFKDKSEEEAQRADELLHFLNASAVPVNRNAALEAARLIEEVGMDFPDALIAASLKLAGVRTFVTRNVSDYKNADLEILTPEQFLKKNK